jgi:hypothetical protein
MLAHSGRALEFTVHPENGPSVTAATNPTDTAGATSQAMQAGSQHELEAWLHGNPVPRSRRLTRQHSGFQRLVGLRLQRSRLLAEGRRESELLSCVPLRA